MLFHVVCFVATDQHQKANESEFLISYWRILTNQRVIITELTAIKSEHAHMQWHEKLSLHGMDIFLRTQFCLSHLCLRRDGTLIRTHC